MSSLFRPFKVNSKKSILLNWEKNIKVADHWDFIIGYGDQQIPNFTYFPLWMIKTDLFRNSYFEELGYKRLEVDKLIKPRRVNFENKAYEICLFMSHVSEFKLKIIEKLETYFKVDKYGKAFDNLVPDKIEIAKKYKFMLTPENAIARGYVTEKLLDAYEAETVPIWWGSMDRLFINKDNHLNILEYDDLDVLANDISNLLKDDKYQDKINLPFLNITPDKSVIINTFKTALGND